MTLVPPSESMITHVDNFTITLEQPDLAGSPWTVRVHRKVFFLRRLVTSDWFLDERQARTFATQLIKELGHNASTKELIQRKPGWTLRRPAR